MVEIPVKYYVIIQLKVFDSGEKQLIVEPRFF